MLLGSGWYSFMHFALCVCLYLYLYRLLYGLVRVCLLG